MVGGLQAGRRVAAAALLALGSVVPHNGPLLSATQVAPMADTNAACAVTVGAATTDLALAVDAARAIAVGYTATDCMPDATLLAAAEARAAIPLGSAPTAATGSPLGGSSSLSAVAVAPTTTPLANTPSPTTDTPTPTATSSTEPSPTENSATESDSTESDSTDGSSSGTEGSDDNNGSDNNGSNYGPGDESTNNNNVGCVDTGSSTTADVAAANDTATGATTDGTGTLTNGTTTGGTVAGGTTTTAACTLGWGTATGVEDFDDAGFTNWSLYDGPGHAGKGIRSPEAMSVNGGILTITGDSNGTTGGMAWKLGRSKYGRWEARVKSPVADPSYNAVMLLWPDAENWPVGGEVDFMEIGDETRQDVDFFLHYGAENHQLHGQVQVDATQWHNWAVEWSPTKITGYLDGKEWFTTTQASALPPGPMHLTLQLDWFPKGGSVQQSAMHVDWVRYYPIEGSGAPGEIVNSLGATSDTGVTLAGIAGGGEAVVTSDSGTGDAGTGGDVPGDDSESGTSGGDTGDGDGTVIDDPADAAPTSPAAIPTTTTAPISELEATTDGGATITADADKTDGADPAAAVLQGSGASATS